MVDTVFLLRPDFTDAAAGPGEFYCPSCATVRGLLAYYPRLLDVIDVREVDFPRPRAEVARWLGEDHPGCPVLVLDPARAAPAGVTVQQAPTGRHYIAGAADIGRYLAAQHAIAAPHP